MGNATDAVGTEVTSPVSSTPSQTKKNSLWRMLGPRTKSSEAWTDKAGEVPSVRAGVPLVLIQKKMILLL